MTRAHVFAVPVQVIKLHVHGWYMVCPHVFSSGELPGPHLSSTLPHVLDVFEVARQCKPLVRITLLHKQVAAW